MCEGQEYGLYVNAKEQQMPNTVANVRTIATKSHLMPYCTALEPFTF